MRLGVQGILEVASEIVLNASLNNTCEEVCHPPELSHPALESRVLVIYVVALSSIWLGIQRVAQSNAGGRARPCLGVARDVGIPPGGYIAQHGGPVIFAFQATRLLANFGITVLAFLALLSSYEVGRVTITIAGAYATLLSTVVLFKPITLSHRFATQSTIIALAIFAVLTYRDVWPYATFTLVPTDLLGAPFWTMLALSGTSGMVVPLLEPYPRPVSYEVGHKINPEETASIFSWSLFLFLDPLISRARGVKHLDYALLPPAVSTDALVILKDRAARYLDPFYTITGEQTTKPRPISVFTGILRTYRASWVVQALLVIVYSCAQLGTPIGTHRLLQYLESHKGTNDNGLNIRIDLGDTTMDLPHVVVRVRPGVWIAWITLAPLVHAVVINMYLWLNARVFVHNEAVLTALVYEHALRVRVLHTPQEADDAEDVVEGCTIPPVITKDVSANVSDEGIHEAPSEDGMSGQTTVTASASVSSIAETTTTSSTPTLPTTSNLKGKGSTSPDVEKKQPELIGRLSNLVTSDVANINGAKNFLEVIISVPLLIVLGTWFLYSILGSAALVGLAVMVVLTPVPAWITRSVAGVQKRKMANTDARVAAVSEVLGMLRVVKMFGWEGKVRDRIEQRRQKELESVLLRKMYDLVIWCSNFTLTLSHMVATFAWYTLVQRRPLSAAIVFSALPAFELIRGAIFDAVWLIPFMVTARVSIVRLQEFLNDTELLDRYTPNAKVHEAAAGHQDDLGLANSSFSWGKESSSGSETSGTFASAPTVKAGRSTFWLHINSEIMFKRGSINLIVGPTGSGKTSMLMALLGEMHYVPNGPSSWVNLPRTEGVAYCAQVSWVQNLTIRENILFGAPFDEARYKKVIYQCGLKRDLSLLDAGDRTEVGEKGLTLSGGQKARVALARAVYSKAGILLLDDILAALDVHTAAWIVKKCLCGDLVRDRTVLLVTHNVALTAPIANFVVSFGSDGRLVATGLPKDILLKDKALIAQIEHEQEALELEDDLAGDDTVQNDVEDDTTVVAKGAKLVLEEEVQVGRVTWKAVSLFLGAFNAWPLLFWTVYFAGQSIAQAGDLLEVWWLGHWATAYSYSRHVDVVYYLGIYTAIVAGLLAVNCLNSALFTFATVRASRIVHDRLLASMLSSTFRWLDITPLSRIITRCTQDIQSMDDSLPNYLRHTLGQAIQALARLIGVVINAPVFIFPGFIMAGLGVILSQLYLKVQLSVKRERSNAKAPVLAEVTGAFAGLTSIRAFGAQQMFADRTTPKIDKYSHVSVIFLNLNKWIAIRIQMLSSAFAGGLAVYLVYGPGAGVRSAASIGFALNMAVSFSSTLIWGVRMANQLEVEANSLERIQQYLEIEKEAEPKEAGTPPAYWPASGDLRVENLVARYSADGPVVLDKISFHIKSGERVGVVGRTGSGKSTLTLALLRCIVTGGLMYYDGVPVHSINLDALRSNITIIPQAPELMAGTLRRNLDMFGERDDAELNSALRSAGLFSLQSQTDDNRLTLDSQIAAGGGNVSIGQRQVISLARALVRQSKLLILDEATSAIDYETDAVIQESLRTELRKDVTVITIAHRLQTIMDSDKIMVLDGGKLVEFDSPAELLGRDGSLFRALVEESADKEQLYGLVQGKERL